MLAAIIVLTLFAATCYLVDQQKQRSPLIRWALARGKYIVQYETILGLWLPYRGGGSFDTPEAAQAWIDAEIDRLSEEIKDTFGPPKRAQ